MLAVAYMKMIHANLKSPKLQFLRLTANPFNLDKYLENKVIIRW